MVSPVRMTRSRSLSHRSNREIPLSRRRLSILIVAAKWWPLSARLAMAMAEHGCDLTALCPAGHPLTFVSTVRATFTYSGLRPLRSLQTCILTVRPDIIVPCDDGVVAQIHTLYRNEPSLRPLIEHSLGAPESHRTLDSRYELLQIAARIGIATPTTHLISSSQDILAWHQHSDSAVLKIDGECGGNGVRICGSPAESVAAWRNLKESNSVAVAIKRLVIERDPLALWSRGQHAARQICVQSLIRGRPANTMVACLRGQVIAFVSVVVLVADGPTGAATVVRTTDNEQMARAARLLVQELKLTGFYGLDFMLDGTGRALLIELNPRCTQLGHLVFPGHESLAGAFSAAWQGQLPLAPDPGVHGKSIAFFPQALASATSAVSKSQEIAAYCDAPTDEPKLLQELIRAPWPQRRWLSRLYHLARPPIKPRQVAFDDSGNATLVGGEPITVSLGASRSCPVADPPPPQALQQTRAG